MGKKKTKTCTYHDLYIVRYDYQKDDGYWSLRNEEDVLVEITNPKKGKCSHEEAGNILKEKYKHLKNLTVTCVIYV